MCAQGVRGLCMRANNTELVSGGSDGTLIVWDATQGTVGRVMKTITVSDKFHPVRGFNWSTKANNPLAMEKVTLLLSRLVTITAVKTPAAPILDGSCVLTQMAEVGESTPCSIRSLDSRPGSYDLVVGTNRCVRGVWGHSTIEDGGMCGRGMFS